MATLLTHKTNFTSGEISSDVLGRTDLSAYDNGALKLKNIFIDPIGGISRRAGLRYIDSCSNAMRRFGMPGFLIKFVKRKFC